MYLLDKSTSEVTIILLYLMVTNPPPRFLAFSLHLGVFLEELFKIGNIPAVPTVCAYILNVIYFIERSTWK